ncbi:anthrone oxygenase family protein [Kribbella sp. NPDC026596]|uniref:anthrone oxygenase family protein n=1 Tax=Kribbella sp. NPDC026596 TaxID=3155122 RepID=UPI0033F76357
MRSGILARIARSASQICCGILVGVALTVLVLELALRSLDGPHYVVVRQAEYEYFTWFIGAVFVATLIAVVTAVTQAYKADRSLLRPTLIALVLILLAVAVTLVVNGPINLEQQRWNAQAPPTDWARIRDRWQMAHAVRTAALCVALGYLTAPPRRGR